jgi:hypothetical protein
VEVAIVIVTVSAVMEVFNVRYLVVEVVETRYDFGMTTKEIVSSDGTDNT